MSVINGHDVEARMEHVRARLQQETKACRQARDRWTDWRTHVKAHPWLAFGLTAALGYAIVPGPRRRQASESSPVAQLPPFRPEQPSLASRMFSGLGQRVAQQALTFGASWALAQLTAAMNQPPVHREPPVETPLYSEDLAS